MNIQQMVYFSEVCRCGSFSSAAKNLFISQQGLSTSISRLESEFSCKFFVREAKGVKLTKEGRFLWDQAKKMLASYDECVKYFAQRQPAQKLRIASTFGALPEFAGGPVSRFTRNYPNIEIEITEYPDKVCDYAVETGSADIGFSAGPIDLAKFNVAKLFSSRMCLIANAKNPLAAKKSIEIGDLDRVPMVIPDDNFKPPSIFVKFCKDNGIVPDIRFRVGEIFTVHRLVDSQPEYVGLTVESVVKSNNNPSLIELEFGELNLDWTVYLISKRGKSNPITECFKKNILSDCRK